MHVTLTPAYGRDYKSSHAVLADYDAGKDFILNAFDRFTTPINKRQCVDAGYIVTIRFNKMRSLVTI